MEYKSDETSHDKNENRTRNEVAVSNWHEIDGKDVPNPALSPPENNVPVDTGDWKGGENFVRGAPLEEMEASGDFNMEASMTMDDFIRAGGFGARDDINSCLPVASDSTDFEANIRDARDYEEPQGEICRPGLGWTEATGAE